MTLLLLSACAPDEPEKPGDTADPADTADTADTPGDTGVLPVGPCDGGGWGTTLTGPDGVLVVRMDGDDTATGTWDAPVASLEAALDRVLATGVTDILIGPGSFPTRAILSPGVHDGVRVYGCGSGFTTLVESDPADPDSLVYVDGAEGVVLGDFGTDGGRRPLRIDTETSATVSSVEVANAVRSGVFVFGNGTVTLTGLEIVGVEPEEGAYGYGASFVGGNPSEPLTIMMEGGEIREATAAGVVADQVALTLAGVVIAGTRPSDVSGLSLFGRGVQVQSFSTLTMTSCTVSDNADAAVYVVTSDAVVTGSELLRTALADLPDGDATLRPGDGLVVRRGDSTVPVSEFTLSVADNTIDGNQRAGILVEDVTVEAASGNAGTNIYEVEGTSFLTQGAADAAAAKDSFETPPDTLPINEEPLDGG